MKKLSLVKVLEQIQGQADPNKTKEYQFTPLPPEQKYVTPTTDPYGNKPEFNPYEAEGEWSDEETGADMPFMAPNQQGSWQKSQIPQAPVANQEIEDFSQQMEQDSPPVQPSRPLGKPAQLQPNTSPQFQQAAPWRKQGVATVGQRQAPKQQQQPRRKASGK